MCFPPRKRGEYRKVTCKDCKKDCMDCDSVEEEALPGEKDAGEDRDGSYRATMGDQQAEEPGMCWRNPLVYGPHRVTAE